MIEGAAARCPKHPDMAAAATCNRCGRFVCADCLRLEANQVLCAECHQRDYGGKASGRAVGALVLALVGLNCFPFLGIVALVMANAELAAIARGESPAKGINLAKGARVLGWIEIVLLGVGLVLLVALLLSGSFWEGFSEGFKEAFEEP